MSELAARKTPIEAEDLRQALYAAWCSKFGSEPPTNAVELLMSQSALETGAWVKCIAFNLGNVKSPPGANGDFCYFTTFEDLSPDAVKRVVAASTPAAPAHAVSETRVVLEPRHPGCRFRAFSSLEEGVDWYLGFLAAHETTAWPAILDGNMISFVHALKQHGYFTAAEHEYDSGVARFFDEYGSPHFADMSAITAALAQLGYATVTDFQAEITQVAISSGNFTSASAFVAATGFAVDNTVGPLTRAMMRWALGKQVQPPDAA